MKEATQMSKEFKSFDLELKIDEEAGTFEGYGSTFGNKDLGGDIVQKGAFKKCLENKDISDIDLLYSHDTKEIIGEFLEMREDENGLFFKGKLYIDEIKRASEVRFLMMKKKLKSMSIGFFIKAREFKGNSRILKELELDEISVVRRPMNPEAAITGVKSEGAKMNVEDVEERFKSLSDFEDYYKEPTPMSIEGSKKAISIMADLKKISGESESHPDSSEVDESESQAIEEQKQKEADEAQKKDEEALKSLDDILKTMNQMKGN